MANQTVIGSRIGKRYNVIDKLGEGGMSVVWLVRDVRLEKLWAVKEIKKDNDDPVHRVDIGLMRKEANIMKNLDHPNIVHVVDIIDEDGSMYVFMDYVQGKDLAKVMAERAKQSPDGIYAFPEEQVIAWGIQLCDALQYLHDQNPPVIYRDMKPANVMLQSDGTVKIVDFGIAREFKSNKELDTRPLGTRGFASPEAVENLAQTDARSDVYSMGVTLFHLVTGHSPMEFITQPDLPPIRSINPTLSPALEATIIRATQWNPDKRQQSMNEMRYELEHPVEPERQLWMEKTVARFKSLAIGGVLCFLLGVGLLATSMLVRNSSFDGLMSRASTASAEEQDGKASEAERLYMEAAEVNPNSIAPYQKLVEDVYKDDGTFTVAEGSRWSELFEEHRSMLEGQPGYSQLCYDAGIDYFIYYEYGDELSRGDAAVPWFSRALEGGNLSEELQLSARNYVVIGEFKRKIQNATAEGNEREAYGDYWNAMRSAVERAAGDETIVQLRLYNVIFQAIDSPVYLSGFMRAGIRQEDAIALLDRVQAQTQALADAAEASDVTAMLYQEITSGYEGAKGNIEHTFGSAGARYALEGVVSGS